MPPYNAYFEKVFCLDCSTGNFLPKSWKNIPMKYFFYISTHKRKRPWRFKCFTVRSKNFGPRWISGLKWCFWGFFTSYWYISTISLLCLYYISYSRRYSIEILPIRSKQQSINSFIIKKSNILDVFTEPCKRKNDVASTLHEMLDH